MSVIKLQSSDGTIFETKPQVVQCSGTIRQFLESMPRKDDILPLPNVNSAILRMVLEWADFHKDDPIPTRDEDEECRRNASVISSWDANFLKVDESTLSQLTKAARYLDIKDLLDVICKTYANLIIGKRPEEISNRFKIHSDHEQ